MKVYVLDASVILHNWAILRDNKTKVVPYQVLEEIEKFRTESGELGDNARSASNFLSGLMEVGLQDSYELESGGKIYLWMYVPGENRDERIIKTVEDIKMHKFFFNDEVILLTKAVSLRIKARAFDVSSEDYDDVGMVENIDGWHDIELEPEEYESLKYLTGETFELYNRDFLRVNEYVVVTNNGKRQSGLVYRYLGDNTFQVIDKKPHLCGVVPRNFEQIMLTNALLNDDIPLVSAIGLAGSGKSLLAIAAAIQKVLCDKKYKKIIITRPIMPIGKDIGYLPGGVEEKMAEWVRPFTDNIEYIKNLNIDAGKRKVAFEKLSQLLDLSACKDIMEILPITYIRGSSIRDAFIIVDEAQNATPSEMKTIITRVGEGSKLVLMGDVHQIDNRFLSRDCNGLALAVKKFHGQSLYSHVTLKNTERSALAKMATEVLFN